MPRLPLSTRTRILGLAVLIAILFDVKYLRFRGAHPTVPRFGDFLGFWSYGRMVVRHRVADLYDPAIMGAAQHALEPHLIGRSLPFFYPPPMLFLVAPLGWLAQPIAFACWVGLGVASFALAAFSIPFRPGAAMLFLVLPATLVAAGFGQSGLFAGAILLGGMRLVPSRPVLGGAVLGLIVIKPQLGLMLPVALLAAREGRAIAATALSAATVGLLSAACFGWRTWADWLHALPQAAGQWHTDAANLAQFSPTFKAGLLVLGAPPLMVGAVQIACAALSGWLVWRACRPGLDERAMVVVCAAVFLASPHAMIYDLPALAGALLLFLARHAGTDAERVAALAGQGLPILAITVTVPLLMPAIMLGLLMVFAAPRLRPVERRDGIARASCEDRRDREVLAPA